MCWLTWGRAWQRPLWLWVYPFTHYLEMHLRLPRRQVDPVVAENRDVLRDTLRWSGYTKPELDCVQLSLWSRTVKVCREASCCRHYFVHYYSFGPCHNHCKTFLFHCYNLATEINNSDHFNIGALLSSKRTDQSQASAISRTIALAHTFLQIKTFRFALDVVVGSGDALIRSWLLLRTFIKCHIDHWPILIFI